jgi:hypothetical protein
MSILECTLFSGLLLLGLAVAAFNHRQLFGRVSGSFIPLVTLILCIPAGAKLNASLNAFQA